MDKDIKNIKYYVELINQIKLDIDSLQEQKAKYETILLNEKSILAKRNSFFSFNGKLKAFIKEIEETIDSLVKNIDEKNKEIISSRNEMITIEMKRINDPLINQNIEKNISIKKDLELYLSFIKDHKMRLKTVIETFNLGLRNESVNYLVDAHNIFHHFVVNGIDKPNSEYLKTKIFSNEDLKEFSTHIDILHANLEEILNKFENKKKIIKENYKKPSNYTIVKDLHVYYTEFNEILKLMENLTVEVINIKNNDLKNFEINKELLMKKNENEFIFSLRENYNLNIF